MARFGDKSASEMARYSDAELAVINDFLTRMAEVTRDEANALRDTPDREVGSAVRIHAHRSAALSRARLLFRSGANELLIRGSADIDDLYRAKFDGPVPAGPAARRDRLDPVQGPPAVGLARPAGGRRRSMPACRGTSRSSAGRTSSRASSTAVDLRSFELTGGVDQLRLTLGRPVGRRPDPPRRWREPRPVRTTEPAATSSCGCPAERPGSSSIGQKLGATGGADAARDDGGGRRGRSVRDRGHRRREPHHGRRSGRPDRPGLSAGRRRSARWSRRSRRCSRPIRARRPAAPGHRAWRAGGPGSSSPSRPPARPGSTGRCP